MIPRPQFLIALLLVTAWLVARECCGQPVAAVLTAADMEALRPSNSMTNPPVSTNGLWRGSDLPPWPIGLPLVVLATTVATNWSSVIATNFVVGLPGGPTLLTLPLP